MSPASPRRVRSLGSAPGPSAVRDEDALTGRSARSRFCARPVAVVQLKSWESARPADVGLGLLDRPGRFAMVEPRSRRTVEMFTANSVELGRSARAKGPFRDNALPTACAQAREPPNAPRRAYDLGNDFYAPGSSYDDLFFFAFCSSGRPL